MPVSFFAVLGTLLVGAQGVTTIPFPVNCRVQKVFDTGYEDVNDFSFEEYPWLILRQNEDATNGDGPYVLSIGVEYSTVPEYEHELKFEFRSADDFDVSFLNAGALQLRVHFNKKIATLYARNETAGPLIKTADFNCQKQ
jgi:hypothetical protein